MARKSEDERVPEPLVHPVYLDVPMMVSFLAAIEGGVAYEDESTRRSLTATERGREGGGKVGVPVLSSFLRLDLSGNISQRERGDESEEIKVVRQHTEASLFNVLRQHLVDTEAITPIESVSDLEVLDSGALVEITGEIVGNPLQQMVDLFTQLMPYMGIDEATLRKPNRNRRRSGNPATAAAANQGSDDTGNELRMLLQMRDDLAAATVQDVVLEAGDMKAVLTPSTEFFSGRTVDYLLAGRFTALGKVTRVLDEHDSINLVRRTVFGAAGPTLAASLINDVKNIEDLFLEVSEPIIGPPAVQLLPLAIFV